MSTIKSSAENLTLNADGANNDIIFQSNGSNIATLDQAGTLTATTFTGAATDTTKLPLAGGTMTGNLSLTTSGDSKIIITSGNSSNGQIRFDDAAGTDRGRVHYEHSNDTMLFKVADTNKARLTADGLCFNSDTAAANALDDYEEGTWTATFVAASGSITSHASYNLCRYTKIGRTVNVGGLVSCSGVSSPSGSLQMHGLPFTVNNNASGETSGNAAFALAGIVDLVSSVNMLTFHPEPNTTYISIEEFTGTTAAGGMAAKWQNGTYFKFSGTYTV